MSEKYKRSYEELTNDERTTLKAIKTPKDITSAEQIGDEWIDDHIICVGAKINDVEVGFWCCGPQLVGTLKYSNESTMAKEDVFKALRHEIEGYEEDYPPKEK